MWKVLLGDLIILDLAKMKLTGQALSMGVNQLENLEPKWLIT